MSSEIFYKISEQELSEWLQLAAHKGARTVIPKDPRATGPSKDEVTSIASNTIRQAKETGELVPVDE